MLNVCAPGHVWKEKTHNFCVYYNGACFPSLPKYQNIESPCEEARPGVRIVKCASEQLGIPIKEPESSKPAEPPKTEGDKTKPQK